MRVGLVLTAAALVALPAIAQAQLEPSRSGRAALAAFNRLDRNGDGAVRPADLLALGRQRGSDVLFTLLDSNGDGRLSVKELGAANGALLARFDAYDVNHDGFVTRREFPNYVDPRLLAALDRNHDGRLSLSELRPAFAGSRARSAPPQPPTRQARANTPAQARPYCWVTGFGGHRWTLEAPVTTTACRTR